MYFFHSIISQEKFESQLFCTHTLWAEMIRIHGYDEYAFFSLVQQCHDPVFQFRFFTNTRRQPKFIWSIREAVGKKCRVKNFEGIGFNYNIQYVACHVANWCGIFIWFIIEFNEYWCICVKMLPKIYANWSKWKCAVLFGLFLWKQTR